MKPFGIVLLLLALAGCEGAASTSHQDPDRLDRIAGVYESGDNATAITELQDYLRTYPRDELAWTILGHAFEKSDRIDDAQSAYESALAIDSRQFQALTGLGIIHRKRGDYDAAMDAYKKALEIDENYAHAYSSMAAIALKRNEDQQALEYARKGYDLDKTDPVIAANLAVAYHYNGDIENRDKFTRIAEGLGYTNLDALQRIFSGEITVRD